MLFSVSRVFLAQTQPLLEPHKFTGPTLITHSNLFDVSALKHHWQKKGLKKTFALTKQLFHRASYEEISLNLLSFKSPEI